MRLIERFETEQHFSEGEPDLEPPEEMAIGEIDEQAQLEEDLDNEDVSEDDVDEEVLAVTLESLVHLDDDEEEDENEATAWAKDPSTREGSAEVDELDELSDSDDPDDSAESLDGVLKERSAELDPPAWDEGDDPGPNGSDDTWHLEVFVCRGCFLVRNLAQLADRRASLCHDCAG